jgi:hypothetical protein
MQKDLHTGNVIWINYEKPLLPEITQLFSDRATLLQAGRFQL